MKIIAMGMDDNNRSMYTDIDIPLRQVTPLHAISEKQEAAYWGIGKSQPYPDGGGMQGMALTNEARIVWFMNGHSEITMQNGDTRRFAAGQQVFVHGKAPHRSIHKSPDTVTLAVTFKATDGYTFK